MALGNLVPYRKAIRPTQPESFPQFVDTELDRVARITSDLTQAIKALDARLTAGGH